MATMDAPTFDVTAATDVTVILRNWEESQQQASFDPVPYLVRLAELVEAETEIYVKMDPDPFDDRHPSRSDPSCNLGHMLKTIFKKEPFMNKLIGDYTRETYWSRLGQPNRDVNPLNIASARLLLDVAPGLESSVVFQETEGLITRLFSWAEKAPNPLQTYATGLLAAAMEVTDIAGNHKEHNVHLVPVMLERLRDILNAFYEEKRKEKRSQIRPFAHLQSKSPAKLNGIEPIIPFAEPVHDQDSLSPKEPESPEEKATAPETAVPEHEFAPPKKRVKRRKSRREDKMKLYHTRETPMIKFENALGPREESSNSSWAELEVNLIGTMQIHPPSESAKMIMILRYLTSLGEYQDLLGHSIEHNALDLILRSVDLRTTGDSRLAFEALKYLSAMLCHKRFALDFINSDGLHRLLAIPRPSIAATGVSLCLYYLASNEDAMERVCSGDQRVVESMTNFALWLLECGHESGRWNATMFFAETFKFTKILELFDQKDGLRLLYNVISTLSMLNEEDNLLDEDREYIEKQSVRHVCASLKKYFEAHMSNKLFTLVGNTGSPGPSYRNQVLKESMHDHIQMMLAFLPYRARWIPVDKFMLLGGVQQMLSVIGMAYDWTYSGRAETVRSALEVLALVTVYPKAQLALCEKVSLPDENAAVGMHIILGASEGEIVNDPEVQKAALSVIINCVCASVHRVGDENNFVTPNMKRKGQVRAPEELLEKMWECVRANNGIMVLLQLLLTKSPITDADAIRALACQALCGIARSSKVTQIMSQLPLFTTGQLQVLSREPVLQDKRQEHVRFQKFALELLEKVSGKTKPALNEFEYSLDRIRKADIVAQTRITYNEKQLLQLIQQYLVSRGYQNAAEALQRDADLPSVSLRGASAGFPPRSVAVSSPAAALRQIRPLPMTPAPSVMQRNHSQETPVWAPLSVTPRSGSVKRLMKTPKSIQKPTEAASSSLAKIAPERPPGEVNQTANLEDIVKEYLMNQHALCKNPMVTCPEFDLLLPHKCPDPKPRGSAPTNFTMRYFRRETRPPFGGPMGGMMDRHFVYSRYRPQRTIRPAENESSFTCATFSACEQFVMVGTNGGEMKLFNKITGADEATYTCHDSAIFRIEPNREGSLVLTSSSWRRPLSALWSMGEFFDLKYSFDDEESVEFSKMTQDRIVGTRNEVATIYDVNTGQSIMTLKPASSNAYTRNQATFNYSDELLLSDGVLWDVTSGKEIHKFDKLNQQLSGSFHPNGLEIVSNAEIWDLRTFNLLRTVPGLAQCHPVFGHGGRVMYGVPLEKEHDEDNQHFETSFKVLDALTYFQIATIDVKRSIYSLAIDTDDVTLALVENTGRDDLYNDLSESVVKLYEVGKGKDEDQAPEAEDEEASESDDDDDDDGRSGSDAEFLDNFDLGDRMSDWDDRSGSSMSSFTSGNSGSHSDSSWVTESSDDGRQSPDGDDDVLSALNS